MNNYHTHCMPLVRQPVVLPDAELESLRLRYAAATGVQLKAIKGLTRHPERRNTFIVEIDAFTARRCRLIGTNDVGNVGQWYLTFSIESLANVEYARQPLIY